MKLKILFLAATVTLTLTLAACKKPADQPADAAPAADTAAAPATDAAAPAATAATDTATSTVNVGVPECDDYLTKVKACLADKAPAEHRAAMESALEQSRSGWAQAASTPEGKAALANTCKSALEQSKAQYSAMGCTL